MISSNVSGFQTLSVLESVFFHAIFHPLCQNKYKNIGFITEKGVKGLRHSVSFFCLKDRQIGVLMFTLNVYGLAVAVASVLVGVITLVPAFSMLIERKSRVASIIVGIEIGGYGIWLISSILLLLF